MTRLHNETFSAVDALCTAGTPTEQRRRDAIGESAHWGNSFDYHGSANEDVRPCSNDDVYPNFVITTRTNRSAKSDVTSHPEPG